MHNSIQNMLLLPLKPTSTSNNRPNNQNLLKINNKMNVIDVTQLRQY